MLRKKSQARRGKSQSQRRYSILEISSLFFRGKYKDLLLQIMEQEI